MKTKTITLPDGWRVKEVVGDRIILEEIKKELPKTWEECAEIVNVDDGPADDDRRIVPSGLGKPMLALCQLLICRNAWWKQLGWKPNWKSTELKYAIGVKENCIQFFDTHLLHYILVFPTTETRIEFYEAFRNLIEEAKELL